MSIEDGGDSRPQIKRYLERRLGEYKLDSHALNIVEAVYYVFRDRDTTLPDPKKYLLHYEEHARKTYSPRKAELHENLSDPVAVAAFDAIIDALRQNFDTIKEKGHTAVEEYCSRLRALIDQKR